MACAFVGGWWSGVPTLSYDKYVVNGFNFLNYLRIFLFAYECLPCSLVFCLYSQFIPKVEEKCPKDADLTVACQRGLRSILSLIQ